MMDRWLFRTIPFIALAALVACSASQAENNGRRGGPPGMMGDARATPVAARTLAPVDMEVTLRGSANLRPADRVEVLPKQTGVIARIAVEEGARVRAGAALAYLDAEEWQLQARQADARARQASDAAERAGALLAEGLMSDQEAQRLRSEAEVAASERELAQLRVRNAVIRSPIDGVVTHRNVERGTQVTASSSAFIVADISRLEAVVGIPEREAAPIRPGQSARIRVEGGPGVPARVARVRPVVDVESGTVQVTVEVDADAGAGLVAGQFVNVDIVTETLENRFAVPRTAVLVDGAAPRIFRIRDGVAEEVEITLGVSQGDQVEIRNGIQPGDTIVTVGQDNLREGAPIRLMEIDGQRIDRPAPEAPQQAVEAPTREQIVARLRERGMSAEEANRVADQIERGERPAGRGGARGGQGGGSPR